jgi:UDP-N-acetylglucosamine 2-epimerase (non-hydrolysing)
VWEHAVNGKRTADQVRAFASLREKASTKRLKILSVIGARPNFVKISPIAHELARVPDVTHVLVHTGQHYHDNLSTAFFRELRIPQPDLNLEVGSGTHAWQTAEIMKRLEPHLGEIWPDWVLVVGDVNSTLAGALTAAKLGLRVAHVEAGLRSFDPLMPEEINRKLTDAMAEILFATEKSGVENLRCEGVPQEKILLAGNVMVDALLEHLEQARRTPLLDELGLRDQLGQPVSYAMVTLHRPSNVDDPEMLGKIASALEALALDLPVVFPAHPRTRARLEALGFRSAPRKASWGQGLILLEPLGYLDFTGLMAQARLVLTDSGGIQEETTALDVPCLTLRHTTERPATVELGTNEVTGPDPARWMPAARDILKGNRKRGVLVPLWDGKAAKRIVEFLMSLPLGRPNASPKAAPV